MRLVSRRRGQHKEAGARGKIPGAGGKTRAAEQIRWSVHPYAAL